MEPLGATLHFFCRVALHSPVELFDDVAVVEGSDCEASTVRLGQTGI